MLHQSIINIPSSFKILQHESGEESEECVLEHMEEMKETCESKEDETCSAVHSFVSLLTVIFGRFSMIICIGVKNMP